MMNATFQEDEMYVASRFLKELGESFMELLKAENQNVDSVKTSANAKIDNQKRDIEIIENKINEARHYIAFNKQRVESIPNEIRDLENDNNYCQREIDSTPIPVYEYYYDRYGNEHSIIDRESTDLNISYVNKLTNRIDNNKLRIKALKEEKEKRESNISNLDRMIFQMKQKIEEKRSFISEINTSIETLSNDFSKYQSLINKSINLISDLDKKVLQCASLIASFGKTFKEVGYNGTTISYSSKLVLDITGNSLKEEIDALSNMTNTNITLLSNCSKAVSAFNVLEGDVIRETGIIANKSLSKIKNINEINMQNSKKMKKALEYLITYENVHF